MEYAVVCAVALVASALTLFSGFGLGTLLLPAFALVFPVEIAVSATAVVHLANNLFKLALVGRHARPGIVIRFGLPAVVAAGAGAWVLARLTGLPSIVEYDLGPVDARHPTAYFRREFAVTDANRVNRSTEGSLP